MALQPSLDLGVLVSRVVIRNQMDVLVLRSLAVDEAEKFEPLLMAVLRHTGPNHRSIPRIERREQSRRPIALVVVGHGASTASDKRKSWLGSVQRLDLALLVNREHQRVLRRV